MQLSPARGRLHKEIFPPLVNLEMQLSPARGRLRGVEGQDGGKA